MTHELTLAPAADIVPFKAIGIDPEIAALLDQEMDGLQLPPPPRIKVPAGGGITFEIPTEDPNDPDSLKEVVGVILFHHPVNRWYATGMDEATEEDRMPDCWSVDGKAAKDKVGATKFCEGCPLNEWGSGEGGRGKACANRHRLYVLTEQAALPYILELPPTSMKNLSPYIYSLVMNRKRPSWSVLTKITLKKAQSRDGITYSELQFAYAGSLETQQALSMTAMGTQYADAARKNMPKINELTGEISQE
jgi:hypothetical protein